MSTRNHIPSALEPYLQLPPETSLILLTGTLACSPNWLTARFVSRASSAARDAPDNDETPAKQCKVVLVSWMRDSAFWKTELRRATGLDTTKLAQSGQFSFVDAFNSQSSYRQSNLLADVEKEISAALTKLSKLGEQDILLVLDNPDVLLATGLVVAQQLNDFILKLRCLVTSTVLVCSADLPLLSAATQSGERHALPIETETAAFLVQQAHASTFVISVRELDTGAAKDVSGVLRITRGGGAYGLDDSEQLLVREMEELYLVQRDGKVKVFGRGTESA